MRYSQILVLCAALILVFGACKENSPSQPIEQNPEELITRIVLSLTDSSSSAVVTATWSDPDGPGGSPPMIDTLLLTAGRTFFGTIDLFNDSVSPPDTITNEIAAEANVHQLFYTVSGGVVGRINVERTDLDTNNPPLPIGLTFTVRVSSGGAATGSLRIVLSHYDQIAKSANPSPESDVDILFPVRIP